MPTGISTNKQGVYGRTMHFMTGHYGLAFNETNAAIESFGYFEDGLAMHEAHERGIEEIATLADAQLRFEAGDAENPAVITGFFSPNTNRDDRAQLRDAGRFMNFVEFPHVTYANATAGLTGRVDVASAPRHVVFNHTVNDPTVVPSWVALFSMV